MTVLCMFVTDCVPFFGCAPIRRSQHVSIVCGVSPCGERHFRLPNRWYRLRTTLAVIDMTRGPSSSRRDGMRHPNRQCGLAGGKNGLLDCDRVRSGRDGLSVFPEQGRLVSASRNMQLAPGVEAGYRCPCKCRGFARGRGQTPRPNPGSAARALTAIVALLARSKRRPPQPSRRARQRDGRVV